MTVTAPRKSLEPWLKDAVEFYPHQVDGVRTLARIPNFLLADDMGLGKSLQALAVFSIDVALGQANIMVVVCPVSLRGNWADEITKFTSFPYLLLGQEPHPSKPDRYKLLTAEDRKNQLRKFLLEIGPRIVICNYEQIIAHQYEFFGLIDFLCLDEAHLIKNHEAKRTQAILGLRHKRVALLTGTPLLNQVGELWPLLHLIDRRRWPDPKRFINRYAVWGGFKGKQIVGAKNVKELNESLARVMVRRLKKDVLTLPEVRIIQIGVDLHPTQRRLYDELEQDLILPDENGDPQDIDNALVKFLRLKQICGSTGTVPGHEDESYKLDCVVDRAMQTMLNGEKVVIYTQFRDIQRFIIERLRRVGISKYGVLHGDVPADDRYRTVKNWTAFPYPAPLVCMLQVAGVGLNLVAARTGIFADKLFVPGLNRQAIDRQHRIGQQEAQPVEIYEIIARGTIEARIEHILRSKVKLTNEIVEESIAFQEVIGALARTGGL